MPALFVLAICSGVKFMIISVKKAWFARLECLPLVSALVLWCLGAALNLLHCNK
jgi:hypothetical protein